MPHFSWCIVEVEDTVSGEDGLVRAVNIRKFAGRKNFSITKLLTLEVITEDLPPKQGSSKTFQTLTPRLAQWWNK